jgi:hypothetical protein
MIIKKFPNGDRQWGLDNTTVVDNRTFNVRNYWLPISRTEINKAPALLQNPGYTK